MLLKFYIQMSDMYESVEREKMMPCFYSIFFWLCVAYYRELSLKNIIEKNNSYSFLFNYLIFRVEDGRKAQKTH